MKDYSSLTKKELIDKLHILEVAHDIAHKDMLSLSFFVESLGWGLYTLADIRVDSLPFNDDLKDSLRIMCRKLGAVTPQGGI